MVPSFGAAKQTEGVTTVAFFHRAGCSSGVERTTKFQSEVCLLGVNQLIKYFICCEATFEVVLVVLAVSAHGKQEKRREES